MFFKLMSYPSLDSIIIFLKSLVTFANNPVWVEYSFILFASAVISVASILAFMDTGSLFLPFKSNVTEPFTPLSKGPNKTFVFAETFTPVPANSVFNFLAKYNALDPTGTLVVLSILSSLVIFIE